MTRGILASVFACAMFGAMYYIVTLMKPLTAQEIFAWRMALTGPVVCVLMTLTRDWLHVRAALRNIVRRPGVMLIHLFNAANVAAQMWVFMWAHCTARRWRPAWGIFPYATGDGAYWPGVLP
jgi:chloramphenicol-sensitive protein RarD